MSIHFTHTLVLTSFLHFSNVSGTMRVTLEDTKKASTLLIRKLFLLMQDLALHKTELQHLQNINFITPVSRASVRVYEAN